jgi:hypothetical protein
MGRGLVFYTRCTNYYMQYINLHELIKWMREEVSVDHGISVPVRWQRQSVQIVVRNVKCPSNRQKGDQFIARNAFLSTGNPGTKFFFFRHRLSRAYAVMDFRTGLLTALRAEYELFSRSSMSFLLVKNHILESFPGYQSCSRVYGGRVRLLLWTQSFIVSFESW